MAPLHPHHYLRNEIIAWYGTFAILVAYATVSFNILSSNSPYYQLLNGTGSLAMILNCWVKKDIEPMILNIIWLIIALVAMGHIIVR